MLYTIINEYDIFYSPVHERQYKNSSGMIFEGEQTAKGLKIDRIISTNPQDYLKNAGLIGQYMK